MALKKIPTHISNANDSFNAFTAEMLDRSSCSSASEHLNKILGLVKIAPTPPKTAPKNKMAKTSGKAIPKTIATTGIPTTARAVGLIEVP